jgi:hypothetical protein
VPVWIKHRRERPAWMNEDECWIFGGGWEPLHWADREQAVARKLAGGDRQILHEWGTRQGGRGLGAAAAAILFVDAPILQSVDLVDLPGIGAIDRPEEEAHARAVLRWADAALYLSPANSFLKATDLAFLADVLRFLPRIDDPELGAWANLFVIASQAGGVEGGNQETLARILDLGAGRLAHVLRAAGVVPHAANTEDLQATLRRRLFTYAIERPELRAQVEAELPRLIALLPKHRAQRADEALPAFAHEALQDLATERERIRGQMAAAEAHRWAQPGERQARASAVRAALGRAGLTARQAFLTGAEALLSPAGIRAVIGEERLSPTEANDTLPALLGARLATLAERELTEAFQLLHDALDDWAAALPPHHVGFDGRGALVSALQGAPTLGGIAAWATARGYHSASLRIARGEELLGALRPQTAPTSGWAGRIGGLFARLVGGGDWAAKLAQTVAEQARTAGTAEAFAQAVIDRAWAETEAGFAAVSLAVEEAIAAWAAGLEEGPDLAEQERRLADLDRLEPFLRGLIPS